MPVSLEKRAGGAGNASRAIAEAANKKSAANDAALVMNRSNKTCFD
jgi:hypothetical protein